MQCACAILSSVTCPAVSYFPTAAASPQLTFKKILNSVVFKISDFKKELTSALKMI